MRIVVLSDTHAPRYWKSCPPAVASQLRGADLILHAGDVCTADVLDELAQYAPVTAVVGNNDGPDVAAWGAPDALEADLGGVRLAMVHDSGPAAGRAARLRRRFPDADLVVFGHSHIRWTRQRTASGSSIPGRRPTGGVSRTGRWASLTSTAAGWWRRPSSRSPDRHPASAPAGGPDKAKRREPGAGAAARVTPGRPRG